MSRLEIISPEEVKSQIAQGLPIVIHDGYALHLGQWINTHPGGRLAILHMVGRDATDEINIYHSTKALLMMKKHRIGRVQLPWTNLEPPIRSPDFYKNLAAREKKEAAAKAAGHKSRRSVDLGSAVAIISKRLIPQDACVSRTNKTESEKLPLLEVESEKGAFDKKTHREQYATEIEQKEIEEGLRDNPSIDPATQAAILDDYRELHQQFKDEGLYQCRYSEYGKESIRYGILFAIFGTLLYCKWYLTSAMFLGMFWQQIMFTAHDAGHRGISGNFIIDTLIGAFVADFCCGLSIGWWKSSHNVHHLITNMPEHDPDLQNIPLFSTTPTYMKSVLSSFYNFEFIWDAGADFLVPYQKYTYYPIMALARFNLYMLSWLHLCSPRAAQLGAAWWTRPVEILFMACYWYIYGYCLVWLYLPTWPIRIGFVLISHLITMLLHVQITLSHWGMPTADLGPTESFPQRQLRTTMDVECPAWLDWLHGGLQFQAVHHLFPRVPRHNLRRGQVLVRQFSEKTGIKYHCYNFSQGNKVVLSRLEQVGQMVKIMVDCQKNMAETGESGLLH
ncbi:delta 8-(E)-sphingolipid desaturase [Dothidotthia symphoricarpi CBS 119687]|uniref:Delta 8-(E)-sphingolipid desaturase n=1 Tax=Dothidotthia symphoricarpi CBS 119687 TaxID=1392245 RepID=A0A6A6A2C1_9PLEO|nr:delta 8-(E)-sphingolipid desaturase [Dothidotthia symphoricarpi CBS 119687]KAF2126142.1 delta 8-(E)-sphingolipid desaturase [Dothidotthia symphoricarpi CBS 119687]